MRKREIPIYNPQVGLMVVATGFFDRAVGFLRRRPKGVALVIVPCGSIHTFGMKRNLDVAFFDRSGRVLVASRGLPPRRLMRCRHAQGVIERIESSGSSWYEPGERIGLCIQK